MRIVMVVPTYNEVENLGPLVSRLRAAEPDVDILIVDDNSPDGTGRLADAIAERDGRVSVLHRPGKSGLGAAYVHGFSTALASGYDVVGEMDADGSHRPEELSRLLAAIQDGAELAMGSRWVPGGEVRNWPWSRRLLSRWGNRYARLALGIPLRDATGGYRLFTARALEAADHESVESFGYCFQIDMAWRVWRAGLPVSEVPITFVDRTRGESKMSADIALESFRRVTTWAFRSRVVERARSADLVA